MTFAQNDLAPKSWSLGKSVLILAAIGILAKVLRIDLSQMQIVGLKASAESAALIPGLIGLALIYLLAAFTLARLENVIVMRADAQTNAFTQKLAARPSLLLSGLVIMPLSFFVYAMPYVLGVFASWYLWSDSMAVLKLVLTRALGSA